MASSVLGKRSREETTHSTASSAINARVKRRTRSSIVNDENENPFITSSVRNATHDVEILEVDELADPIETPSKSSRHASVPAKHTTPGGRIALSPTKINTHFRVTKDISQEDAKPTQVATPQTPRHRDALSKKVPVTPRHRVLVAGKPFTPRTPRTPSTPSNVPTIYNVARQLFVRSANPGRLVGRDDERETLNTFISTAMESASGGCMYVSGPPGTGKSALVSEVCSDIMEVDWVKKAYINCMSVKNSKDIYGKLVEDLCDDLEDLESNEMLVLRKMFLPKKRAGRNVYIVTLDEIDHLLTLDLEILYTLFEWSLQRSSRLVLVGIANALDLTDRFLPRLKARNLKPQLLPFLPYTAPQIGSVITTRFKTLIPPDSSAAPDYVPFIHPAAIQLCSKKVASQTGDLRKAFDIIRRALDLVESETKKKHQDALTEQALQLSPSKTPLVENMNLSSSPLTRPSSTKQSSQPPTLAASLATLTPTTAPRITIAHIARISASTFGNGTTQRLQALNLQQKAALCALCALEKKHKNRPTHNIFATPSKTTANAAPTVRALFETYCVLCRRDDVLHPLTGTEFRDVLGSLETLGLVEGVEGRSGSFVGVGLGTPSRRGRGGMSGGMNGGMGDEKRVKSCVAERELSDVVEGSGAAGGILRSLLAGAMDGGNRCLAGGGG